MLLVAYRVVCYFTEMDKVDVTLAFFYVFFQLQMSVFFFLIIIMIISVHYQASRERRFSVEYEWNSIKGQMWLSEYFHSGLKHL